MKTLDLKRIWEVMNRLSYEETKLSEEKDKYVQLLGHSSNYCNSSFEGFLNYYSFRLDGDDIIVFNDDKVAWEDYTVNDFSIFPSVLLSFSAENLEKWIENEIEMQLKQQELNKITEKENIKRQIELLTKKLNNHA